MNADATSQMRVKILQIVDYYGKESNVSVYETIAVLEIIKVELIEELTKHNETNI